LEDSRRRAGDELRSQPLLLLAGKDCGHEDLEQEQNEAEQRHDKTIELTTRKHSIVSATIVNNLFAGSIRFCGAPKITLIPNFNRFSQTELFDFIFPTIFDNRLVNRFVNDSRENETKKFGLGKPVVNLNLV
jgi:predicted 2-oxoglutarate/Fe(II)-dependent dioxygenase YbiX